MARATKKYTKDDLIAILQASEGRLSPVSNEPGHALALHVTADAKAVTARLTVDLSKSTRPIIMGPTGAIAPEPLVRDVWKEMSVREGGVAPNTNQIKAEYKKAYANNVPNSGTFMDLQQAGLIGRYVLNSAEGKAELAKLDNNTAARVSIEVSMSKFETTSAEGWKMFYAGSGTAKSEAGHVADIGSVFMLVDRLGPDPDGMHVQTFYPRKG